MPITGLECVITLICTKLNNAFEFYHILSSVVNMSCDQCLLMLLRVYMDSFQISSFIKLNILKHKWKVDELHRQTDLSHEDFHKLTSEIKSRENTYDVA